MLAWGDLSLGITVSDNSRNLRSTWIALIGDDFGNEVEVHRCIGVLTVALTALGAWFCFARRGVHSIAAA